MLSALFSGSDLGGLCLHHRMVPERFRITQAGLSSDMGSGFIFANGGLLYILIKSRQIGWVPGPSCWSPSCSVDTTVFASARKETQLVLYV